MSRTPNQALAGIAGLLADGWAWDHDLASNTVRSFAPLAGFASTFETRAEAMLTESHPRTAVVLLPAYERVLGPDTCLGEPAALTFDERQLSASARWMDPADASVAGMIALAAMYGVAITITELRRNCAGVLRAGRPVRCHPQQFTWIVGMPAVRVVKFRAGASRAGESIGRIERNEQIECVIRRAAPAHTVPVFQYAAVPGAMAVWDSFHWDSGSIWQ